MAKDTADAATKSDEYVIVCQSPDVCLTKIGDKVVPIPYQITHSMDQSQQVSPNVFFGGKPAFLHDESFVDKVTGDEAGKKGGIVSGVHKKISHSIEHSPDVYINGQPMVRTGDTVWMNWKKPNIGSKKKTLCEALREIAKTAKDNPFLNGLPFDKNNLASEVVPSGGGPGDDSHFTDERNGLTYDVQYVQVGWSITKTYGPGSAELAATGYMLGPFLSGDTNYFSKDNLGANMRGLQLGEFGARHFENFEAFVKDLCPGAE